MIQINLSEKQARDFHAFAMALMGADKPNPAFKAIVDSIEQQLRPRSGNQAEFAVWKSERVLPNLIEAWKRKNEPAEKTFGNEPSQIVIDEVNQAIGYSLQVGGALYNALKDISVNGRSGRF